MHHSLTPCFNAVRRAGDARVALRMSMPENTLSLLAEARATCETRCRGFWSQQLLRASASPCKVLRQAKILFRAATSCAAPARLPALTQRKPLGGRQGSPANAHAGQARSVGRRSAAKANKLANFPSSPGGRSGR